MSELTSILHLFQIRIAKRETEIHGQHYRQPPKAAECEKIFYQIGPSVNSGFCKNRKSFSSPGQELLKQLFSWPRNHTTSTPSSARDQSSKLPSPLLNLSSKNVYVFEGSLNETPLLTKRLLHNAEPVNAISTVVGISTNILNVRVLEEPTHATVAAICRLRESALSSSSSSSLVPPHFPSHTSPKTIFVFSLGANPRWPALMEQPFHWLLETTLSAIYADLPDGLVQSRGKGYEIKMDRDGMERAWMSYEDLPDGMNEVAEMERGDV
ncbi:MAG: hypothetical protein ALECFALPRED_008568 [Alectoria fallacina]|uniref:Uncharacterized protein n=1 Tax=Alectoria fallacina TaxID=1903189 RepID=A0A8H3EF83_9LECA|nr:MAG: hypothetical protein ALECFALPRED_008568 [Alectoria fallacina]